METSHPTQSRRNQKTDFDRTIAIPQDELDRFYKNTNKVQSERLLRINSSQRTSVLACLQCGSMISYALHQCPMCGAQVQSRSAEQGLSDSDSSLLAIDSSEAPRTKSTKFLGVIRRFLNKFVAR
jgi:hypothetical protein